MASEPRVAPAGRHATRRWRRPIVVIALGVVVVAAVASAAIVATGDGSPVARGTPASGRAPALELADLHDAKSTIAIEDFRGRPLVVNFFAAWCAPCRHEMPAFQAVHRRVKSRVAFLGIDNRDIRSDALDLLRETGVRYPTAFDPRGNAARAFGVVGMPTTVFIDARGEMVERHTGEMSEQQLRATIERLFDRRG